MLWKRQKLYTRYILRIPGYKKESIMAVRWELISLSLRITVRYHLASLAMPPNSYRCNRIFYPRYRISMRTSQPLKVLIITLVLSKMSFDCCDLDCVSGIYLQYNYSRSVILYHLSYDWPEYTHVCCNRFILQWILDVKSEQHISQLMRLWNLSHRRPAKAQASLCFCAVSPEPSLFAHMKYEVDDGSDQQSDI